MNGRNYDDGNGRPLYGAVALASVEETMSRPDEADLIFDFTGIHTLDVRSLSLLLTAQQVADRDARTVWVAGLPKQVWSVFRAMGLDDFFREFPGRGDAAA